MCQMDSSSKCLHVYGKPTKLWTMQAVKSLVAVAADQQDALIMLCSVSVLLHCVRPCPSCLLIGSRDRCVDGLAVNMFKPRTRPNKGSFSHLSCINTSDQLQACKLIDHPNLFAKSIRCYRNDFTLLCVNLRGTEYGGMEIKLCVFLASLVSLGDNRLTPQTTNRVGQMSDAMNGRVTWSGTTCSVGSCMPGNRLCGGGHLK